MGKRTKFRIKCNLTAPNNPNKLPMAEQLISAFIALSDNGVSLLQWPRNANKPDSCSIWFLRCAYKVSPICPATESSRYQQRC